MLICGCCAFFHNTSPFEGKKKKELLWLQLNCYFLMSLQSALMPEDRPRLETLREHFDFKLRSEIIGRNERSDQCINGFIFPPFLINFSLHLTCITRQGEVIVCVCGVTICKLQT